MKKYPRYFIPKTRHLVKYWIIKNAGVEPIFYLTNGGTDTSGHTEEELEKEYKEIQE